MKKKLLIIGIILTVIIVGIIIDESVIKKKQWYEEIGEYKIVSVAETFIKEQINYPETYEAINYPDIKYGTEQERTVVLKGRFKCANAFGVYQQYTYEIKLEIKDKWIVKYYNIF